MMRAHLSSDIRAFEAPVLKANEEAGDPDKLMRQAAWGIANRCKLALLERGHTIPGSQVMILVGGGNNGGDGLYAAAYLARRGLWVQAVLLTATPHEAALGYALKNGVRICAPSLDLPKKLAEDVLVQARKAGVWIDALTGIGGQGPLREPLGSLVQALTEERYASPDEPIVIAVDTPSGIGVDDGTLPGPVLPADITVTFGSAKPGLLLPPACSRAGVIHVVDIDVEVDPSGPRGPVCGRIDMSDVADVWPTPAAGDHKYTRGVVGIHAGSTAYPGAGILAVAGAIGAGTGMVRYLGESSLRSMIISTFPEVVTVPGRVQAQVIGPGMDPEDPAQAQAMHRAIEHSVSSGIPAVVDAGALSVVGADVPSTIVLTPHAGELAQLLNRLHFDESDYKGSNSAPRQVTREDVEAAPARYARLAAEVTGATVLLKGAVTVVAAPDGPILTSASAPPWLATGGTGDVLAGILGALLGAYGDVLAQAGRGHGLPARLAVSAAWVHGAAAAMASGVDPLKHSFVYDSKTHGMPLRALEVAHCVPKALGLFLS
ncbi:MAG: NAD(P)H-hydrate epimerase [Actinomycetaceae bacterium]|nr:NAD(P)H-hydrate epimerase [Actinomycetaceae bacterium]